MQAQEESLRDQPPGSRSAVRVSGGPTTASRAATKQGWVVILHPRTYAGRKAEADTVQHEGGEATISSGTCAVAVCCCESERDGKRRGWLEQMRNERMLGRREVRCRTAGRWQ